MIKKIKIQKKLTIAESIQWDGSLVGAREIARLFPGLQTMGLAGHRTLNLVLEWRIMTIDGICDVAEGDFIVRGTEGEYYPLNPEIYKETFDEMPGGVCLDRGELNLVREWYNVFYDLNSKYLNDTDKKLYDKIIAGLRENPEI